MPLYKDSTLTACKLSSSPSERASPPKGKAAPAPRLKITLKFPGAGQSNTTPTPSDEMPLKLGRKGHPRRELCI